MDGYLKNLLARNYFAWSLDQEFGFEVWIRRKLIRESEEYGSVYKENPQDEIESETGVGRGRVDLASLHSSLEFMIAIIHK